MAPVTGISSTPEWAALLAHRTQTGDLDLRRLFEEDPRRTDKLSFTAGDLIVDLSKHLVTADTVELLVALAERAALSDRIREMFVGERINTTEDRPVLHTALRATRTDRVEVDGVDVVSTHK